MPNGTEKRISISQPTKYHCESKNSSECGCYFPSPPVGIDTKYDEKLGCLIDHLYEVPVEVVYNSTYTGVDKNDQYYKDIDNITKLAERIKKGEQP